MKRPAVHLITYATPRFRHRQWFLGASAIANDVADFVHAWSPEKVAAAGFHEKASKIRLDERGSGFWAWKPFVIDHAFARANSGDIILYCDVGRTYPFKLLNFFPSSLIHWMDACGQHVLPGVEIPWTGAMSRWTKRDAFVLTGMDKPEFHHAIPIQASFSFWRVGPKSKNLLEVWLEWSCRRDLISDDPSVCGLPELTDFHDHRHDQSLLTLACLKCGVRGLDLGSSRPEIDVRHPCEVSSYVDPKCVAKASGAGRLLQISSLAVQKVESKIRSFVSFGQDIPQSPVGSF